MNGRVDQAEDPDRRCHVTDTGPHAHHRAGVVIGLQGGALLALGQNDHRINNLVKLGQVEEPAEVSKTLVPKATNISRVGHAVCQVVSRVGDRPLVGDRAVGSGIAVTAGTIDLAE